MLARIKKAYNQLPLTPQLALIGTNLMPLLGIWFLGWDVGTVLFIYWGETAIIGFYTICKLIKAEGKATLSKEASDDAMREAVEANDTDQIRKINHQKLESIFPRWVVKTGSIIFFQLHFGGFMLAHFILLNVLFFSQSGQIIVGTNAAFGVLLAILGLLISHGISYRTNYVQGGEYKEAFLVKIMAQPYRRVAVMHVVIIISGVFVSSLGGFQAIGVTLLVILKILIDLNAHAMEHLKTPEVHQTN